MEDMLYMSDFRRGKGYCAIIFGCNGKHEHGVELGRSYFEAAKELAAWAESNGWEKAPDSPVWFKKR